MASLAPFACMDSLMDSTRTTNHAGSTINWTTNSDLTSEITSTSGNTENLACYEVQGAPCAPAPARTRTGTRTALPRPNTPCCRPRAALQLHRLIGRGKYSQVYAAMHTQTGMRVAMKKVRCSAALRGTAGAAGRAMRMP